METTTTTTTEVVTIEETVAGATEAAEKTETVETVETVEVEETETRETPGDGDGNGGADKDATIRQLRDQVARLTLKVEQLEAEAAAHALASSAPRPKPLLAHPARGRATPHRKLQKPSTADPDADSDLHPDPDPDAADTENPDTTDPTAESVPDSPPSQPDLRKKIASMGGVSAFGAVGFNPFAGGSPSSVLLKPRSSDANANESEAVDALANKFEDVRDWIASTLDSNPDLSATSSVSNSNPIANADRDTFFALLKDGNILCRLISVLFPAHAVKPKPGKFVFIHKENVASYLKACSAAGIAPFFDYDDLINESKRGHCNC
ncbi:hypothetical protein HK100_009421 [Physocladia obscura]|uniref:Calponin-homology (CH) domain-containing protein n=1 Tax=Physocladia obscura TaxID=109957 RepID=A0AAD5XE79_9FUNG|nr:hypothetical protein HK100_009421 [Physocladia obscura]